LRLGCFWGWAVRSLVRFGSEGGVSRDLLRQGVKGIRGIEIMSLSEALLLDPYPFEIFIAYRTDGVKGSGTLNDPYDGSTQYGNPIEGDISADASIYNGTFTVIDAPDAKSFRFESKGMASRTASAAAKVSTGHRFR